MSNEGSASLITKYEKSLSEDPRSRVFAPLAEAYRKIGAVDKAFDVLKKGLRYNPDYLLGYLSLAQCYVEKEHYSLAYSTLRPLISSNSDNIKLQNLFASCAEKTGHPEEALDSYKYLLFLGPQRREIADKVRELEGKLHEEVIIAPSSEARFDVESLNIDPKEEDWDDWEEASFSESSSFSQEGEQLDEGGDEQQWEISSPLGGELQEGKGEKKGEKNSEQRKSLRDLIEAQRGKERGGLQGEEQDIIPPFEFDEEKATPVITHTLVDIYMKQGHYEKAKEILEKIMAISSDKEEGLKKLELINKALNEKEEIKGLLENKVGQSETLDIKEEEGHQNLMDAFDRTFQEGELLPPSSKIQELIDDAHLILEDFLTELRQRASSCQ